MIDSFNIYSSLVTKNEYESTLRAFHESQMEMKSDARDTAAAILAGTMPQHENERYYVCMQYVCGNEGKAASKSF